MPQQLDETALDLLAHDMLPAACLFVDIRPVETDDIAQESLGETMLAHDVDGLGASGVRELEPAVVGDDHEAVALHPPDRLRDGGAGMTETLGDPRAERNDVLFLELEDRAQIHLRRVDEIGHARVLALVGMLRQAYLRGERRASAIQSRYARDRAAP